MKSFKNSVIAALAVSAFTLSGAHAASWQDSLNSAASQLSSSNAQASGGVIRLLANQPAQRQQPIPDRQQHE
ncbi:hypothetical protein MJ588_04295 [Klebsiella pneumoniae]|nr:hypothetical protein MJ588_04295 [Klebsiella pneumoniae]